MHAVTFHCMFEWVPAFQIPRHPFLWGSKTRGGSNQIVQDSFRHVHDLFPGLYINCTRLSYPPEGSWQGFRFEFYVLFWVQWNCLCQIFPSSLLVNSAWAGGREVHDLNKLALTYQLVTNSISLDVDQICQRCPFSSHPTQICYTCLYKFRL